MADGCCLSLLSQQLSLLQSKWSSSFGVYNAGQKKRNSELGIFCGPAEGGGQLWTKSNIFEAILKLLDIFGRVILQHSTINSRPPSKFTYLIQRAHKNLMIQSCVSFDQHCTIRICEDYLSELLWCKLWPIMILHEALTDFPIGDCDICNDEKKVAMTVKFFHNVSWYTP